MSTLISRIFTRGTVITSLLLKLDASIMKDFENQARRSTARLTYRQLKYDLREHNYFKDDHTTHTISVICKDRSFDSKLLKLNFLPNRTGSSIFSLCNTQEREDGFHFIGKCTILREIRIQHWNTAHLATHECVNLLNGQPNWRALADFYGSAINTAAKS